MRRRAPGPWECAGGFGDKPQERLAVLLEPVCQLRGEGCAVAPPPEGEDLHPVNFRELCPI
eukprot:6183113-Alexandrium_andersonii.AAC.1